MRALRESGKLCAKSGIGAGSQPDSGQRGGSSPTPSGWLLCTLPASLHRPPGVTSLEGIAIEGSLSNDNRYLSHSTLPARHPSVAFIHESTGCLKSGPKTAMVKIGHILRIHLLRGDVRQEETQISKKPSIFI